MSAQDAWEALRTVVARRDGARCVYCRVPTAATIEHVDARSRGGGHHVENLRLACPWCNSTKRDEPVESWVARRGWVRPVPGDLEETVSALVDARYGGLARSGVVPTGSTNARLCLQDGIVAVEVRPGAKVPWERTTLGPEDDARVVAASHEFLWRHLTNPGTRATRAAAQRRRFARAARLTGAGR